MAEDSPTNDDVNVDMDNLDEFENVFYNKSKAEPEAKVEDEPEAEEEVNENGDDSPATEDEPEAEAEEEVEEESEDEPKPEPKPKKKSALQTRIDELVAEAREAQRERDALKERLAKVEAREEKVPEKVEVPLRDQLPPEAPNPDAKNDKGELLYPLGEFDPNYIRDLTRFTIEQENKRIKEENAKEEQAKQVAREQAERVQKFSEKVKAVEEDLPDFRDRMKDLSVAFEGIDPAYGDYLANTIMECDNGPEIMYYLSQNIGEARDIVASGPFAATLSIGRLQARLEKPAAKVEEKSDTKKVSDAPAPPVNRTRGSSGRFSVSPDTDDLAAFEREFYGKSK